MVVDVQGAGVVEEVAPDGVGGGGVVSGQVAGEEAVEVAGEDGEGGVEVDVEWDAAGERVEVEAGDVGVEFVFDAHAFGVAGEQVLARGGEVVGDEQGGFVAADVADSDLADLGVDVFEVDHVFGVVAGAGSGRSGRW